MIRFFGRWPRDDKAGRDGELRGECVVARHGMAPAGRSGCEQPSAGVNQRALKQGGHEPLGGEGFEVVRRLAEADKLHR